MNSYGVRFDVCSAMCAAAQKVDVEVLNDPDQERFGLLDVPLAPIDLQPQERFLNQFVGLVQGPSPATQELAQLENQ